MLINHRRSNTILDPLLQHPEVLGNYLIEIIGETVESQNTRIRRIAAKQIIKLYCLLYYPQNMSEFAMAVIELGALICRLAIASFCFAEEIRDEPEPYPADGITFSTLVHLVRIEADLFACSWHAERIRALGLTINSGDEICWTIPYEFITIKDRDENCRRFYRLSS
jgi:hypothetical protein